MTAHAHDSNFNHLSELSALGGLPLALNWDSTLMVISISAFLLAKAAWYSGSTIRSCVTAWKRARR